MNKPVFSSTVEFKSVCRLVARVRASCDNWEFGGRLETALKTKWLGSGCSAYVFPCSWDKSKVIKISKRTDDGWLAYAAVCIKYAHTNNLLLPKIRNLRIYSNFYVALLDRYTGVQDYHASHTFKREMTLVRKTVLHGRQGWPDSEKTKNYDYAVALHDILEEEGLSAGDLHEDNIMYKGRKIIVIDPISGNYSYSKQDLKKLGVKVAA